MFMVSLNGKNVLLNVLIKNQKDILYNGNIIKEINMYQE